MGVLPTALLSSSVFDATSIDTTALRMGPGQAEVAHPGGHFEDVNGDGLLDLLVHFDTPSIAADASTTLLCVVGELSDGEPLRHVTMSRSWATRASEDSVREGARALSLAIAFFLGALFAVGSIVAAMLEVDGFTSAARDGPRPWYLGALALGLVVSVVRPFVVARVLYPETLRWTLPVAVAALVVAVVGFGFAVA